MLFWDKFSTWQEAESSWEERKKQCAALQPIKKLPAMPSTVGIVDETRRFLKLKGLLWVIRKDKKLSFLRLTFSHPFLHIYRYVRSALSNSSYVYREQDLFFFGVRSMGEFHDLLNEPNTVFFLGFSYCQKPFECPSGRFSDQCLASIEHPVCCQCFLGKCMNAFPKEKTVSLVVPTVRYIGDKVYEMKKTFPDKKIVFLISTCEMMLEMLGDFSNMIDIRGVGIRLEGRFCNTFKAFQLAENGTKPGLTCLRPQTERKILDAIMHWREVISR